MIPRAQLSGDVTFYPYGPVSELKNIDFVRSGTKSIFIIYNTTYKIRLKVPVEDIIFHGPYTV